MKNDAMRRCAGGVKLSSIIFCVTVLVAGLPARGRAQVNTGSNGSDGAFNPATSVVINMADHPNGIYQYSSVNIPTNVTVTFIPNANNTPVAWLVQSNVVINGTVNVSGTDGDIAGNAGVGGPGGGTGGNGGLYANPGQGPGGGTGYPAYAGNAFYGTAGTGPGQTTASYGNIFLIPFLGGSGGGGGRFSAGGGGGGGAILVASSGQISLGGTIRADGGSGYLQYNSYGSDFIGGGGSGGAVRVVTSKIIGYGIISANGGRGGSATQPYSGGLGRVRIDTYENVFGGSIGGVFTQGFQPIIIPTAGQGAQLTVTSVGGVPVSASPTGALSTPDAVLSAQQNNPIPIVVSCANLPLNTPLTVSVKPANGPVISATGYNNTGTQTSSTATILLNIPRGGGLIYATAATSN
jgi:hypothetical protein